MKRFIIQQDSRRAAQRRLYAFETTRSEVANKNPDPTQIAFAYTHVNEVDGGIMRRRIADREFDVE